MTPSKTAFAGLERLAPGDSLSSDGYVFQDGDRAVIDRLLRLGAVTHRHDAHAALANPTLAPVVAVNPSGGSIPAATPIYVTYTLLDSDGGETLPVDTVTVTTPIGYPDPTDAPSAAANYTAGTLLAGNYSYGLSITDGIGGETTLGPTVLAVVESGFPTAEVQLSGLAAILAAVSGGDPLASWRLWRSLNGSPWYLLGSGTADAFNDNGVAGDCTVSPPDVSTIKGANELTVQVPGGQPTGVVTFDIYASLDGSFTSPALLGSYPASDLGGPAKVYPSLTPLDGGTPAVSTCVGGANEIDAVTEVVNLARAVAIIGSSQPTGNYTFQQTDVGTVVEATGATGVTYTVPPFSSVPFPIGAVIEVFQEGAGQVTIAPGVGVTLRSDNGRVHTAAQYSTIGLRQRAQDEWVLSGDLT